MCVVGLTCHFNFWTIPHFSMWCHSTHMFLSSYMLLQASKGHTCFSPMFVRTPMHLTWLTARSHTWFNPKLSYLPLHATAVQALYYHPLLGLLLQMIWGIGGNSYRGDPYLSFWATMVKALHYHPLLGLLLQMVSGLVRTSYWGDPVNIGKYNIVNIYGARRRVRWKVESLKSIVNFYTSHIIHDLCPNWNPTCFSHVVDFGVSVDVIDDLPKYKFSGDNGTTLFRYTISFGGFCHRHDVPSDDITYGLFAFMFKGHVKKWCHSLHATSIHSDDHMFKELFCAFIFYDSKAFNRKILKLWKAFEESLQHFHDRFLHYSYEFPKYEVNWNFFEGIFQYLVYIFWNWSKLETFDSIPTYLDIRASLSEAGEVDNPSDPPSPYHQADLAL